jgi:dienelactone hydrolase
MEDACQKEMTKAAADWQLHSYGGTYHAFTKPGANDPNLGTPYNKSASERSWKSMQNFFEEIF